MAPNNINFKLLSLNAPGIWSFGWLMKDKADICFLQVSYSSYSGENLEISMKRGNLFLAAEDCYIVTGGD